jgi:hypothetical protein
LVLRHVRFGGVSVVIPRANSTIARHGSIDEASEMRGLIHRVIDEKFETGRMPQAQPASDLAAQVATRARKSDAHLFRGIPRSEGRKENLRHTHVGRETYGRDGDISNAGIFHPA